MIDELIRQPIWCAERDLQRVDTTPPKPKFVSFALSTSIVAATGRAFCDIYREHIAHIATTIESFVPNENIFYAPKWRNIKLSTLKRWTIIRINSPGCVVVYLLFLMLVSLRSNGLKKIHICESQMLCNIIIATVRILQQNDIQSNTPFPLLKYIYIEYRVCFPASCTHDEAVVTAQAPSTLLTREH